MPLELIKNIFNLRLKIKYIKVLVIRYETLDNTEICCLGLFIY